MPVVITGNNTPTAGGVVYGDGTTYATTSAGTSGRPIVSGGAGAPTFRPYTLPAADGSANQLLQTDGAGALSFTTVSTDPGTHTVFLVMGGGYGSSSTSVRRFQTTVVNTGTAITYADSASLGATFTINTTGMYAVSYTDRMVTGNKYWAVTLNSTGLTIAPEDFPSNGITSQRLIQVAGDAAAVMPCAAVVFRATANDVVRAQADTNMQDNNNDVIFCIRRVG